MSELMTVHEIADYLRVKERKIYDLITQKQIPCTRVTGKWLFSRNLIDLWLLRNSEASVQDLRFLTVPEIIVGSHDPLLEWSLRENGISLARQTTGSMEGLSRFAAGEAMICGLHILDAETGEYNLPLIKSTLLEQEIVVIEWARRTQGLVVAKGNPRRIRGFGDLAEKKARLIDRQEGAGSRILFDHLVETAGFDRSAIEFCEKTARTELEIGLYISGGLADAGIAVASVAKQLQLDFIPLTEERFDLVTRRYDYFEPPVQSLLRFCREPAFTEKAAELGGYDIRQNGRIVLNMR